MKYKHVSSLVVWTINDSNLQWDLEHRRCDGGQTIDIRQIWWATVLYTTGAEVDLVPGPMVHILPCLPLTSMACVCGSHWACPMPVTCSFLLMCLCYIPFLSERRRRGEREGSFYNDPSGDTTGLVWGGQFSDSYSPMEAS